jgi:hypothetical protein
LALTCSFIAEVTLTFKDNPGPIAPKPAYI